ncbi:MAG: metallophosphoesterase [Acidobacteriota bacterium]|nr:metallophosphoesterase [Acidobacteriota bacterium]|tara:strand:+ start:43 stop:888 length:846 start_codon:yes stop_codon:yes gene_type:complete
MAKSPEPDRLSRRSVMKAIIAAGVGGVAATGAYSFLYARRNLEITRTTLVTSGLPEALSGLRIGLLTDLHRSLTVPREDIEKAVTAMMKERPDLIVLGGDYVTWRDPQFVEDVADILAPLTAPHGVFAILGNHDDERAMPAALTAQGFEVLMDARTRITVAGESLDLVGLRFWTRQSTDVIPLLSSATRPAIVLAHDPRRVFEAAALDLSVVLSGHTHGGQIVIPGLGAIAARKFPIASGVFHQRNTTLYVSRGIGTVYVPFRLNCPPEVAILTLARRPYL